MDTLFGGFVPSLEEFQHDPDTGGHYGANQGHIFKRITAGIPSLESHFATYETG